MIKKRIVVLAIMVAILLLPGCSSISKEDPEIISGEVTLKQAIEKEGPQVWYWIEGNGDVGKDSPVSGVLVFEDGTVTLYDRQIGALSLMYSDNGQPGCVFYLGNLSDYISLSNEEAIELAKENYKKAQEQLVDDFAEVIPKIEDQMAKNPADIYYLPQYLKNNEDALKLLQDSYIENREAAPYQIACISDSTGNATEGEAILANDIPYPAYYAKVYGSWDVVTYPSGMGDFAIKAYGPTGISEIYENYVGGYYLNFYSISNYNYGNGDCGCLVTKCEQDAVFNLDAIGTSGIYDDPSISDENIITSEPNP